MDKDVYILNFVTKGLEIVKSENGERDFTGHITVEIVDKQDEFIAIHEVLKAFPAFMSIHPTISDSHSNRGVGIVKDYGLSEIEGHPSVMIKATIYKHESITLYDHVWEEIKSGVRKGLSIGGASKSKVPIFKDGKIIMKLGDLEIYEIASCVDPANRLALVKDINTFAKGLERDDIIKDIDGRQIIQCDTVECMFSKTEKIDKTMSLVRKPIRGKTWEQWDEKLRSKYPRVEERNKIIGSMEAAEKANIKKLESLAFKYSVEGKIQKTLRKLL